MMRWSIGRETSSFRRRTESQATTVSSPCSGGAKSAARIGSISFSSPSLTRASAAARSTRRTRSGLTNFMPLPRDSRMSGVADGLPNSPRTRYALARISGSLSLSIAARGVKSTVRPQRDNASMAAARTDALGSLSSGATALASVGMRASAMAMQATKRTPRFSSSSAAGTSSARSFGLRIDASMA